MHLVPLRYVGRAFVFLLLAVSVLLPQALTAQVTGVENIPLDKILNADGTVRPVPGLTGAIEAHGWKMKLDAAGIPHFYQRKTVTSATLLADSADVHWDSRFTGPSGINGAVQAMAIIGSDLYFAGSFLTTDRVPANNIVKWNMIAQTWTPLGQGVDNQVLALAVLGSDLYAGGDFTTAGGAPARHIARWNGSAWSTLGVSPNDGTDGQVAALAVEGSNLFVGGVFIYAGDSVLVNRIAQWDGSKWSPLGSGMDYPVYALASVGSSLFAGGNFLAAGGIRAQHVARWTGSSWASLGTAPNDGVDGNVFTLAGAGSYLYVGGSFTAAGAGVSANNIARWDGSSWTSLGNGFTGGSVAALLVIGKTVYAAGSFTATGIQTVNHIAAWDTASAAWSSLSNGLDGTADALFMVGSDLYAGGDFTSYFNGSTPSPAIGAAVWSGSSWRSLTNAVGNAIVGEAIYALAMSGPDLYIGGSFNIAGPLYANNIVRYNTTTNSWHTLGNGATNGVDGSVYAVAISGNGDVYAGGIFSHAGGSPANGVARWNGSAWSTLGTSPNDGTNGWVQAIALSGSNVFIGGYFSMAGGATADFVAQWNGSSWSPLGSGTNSIVLGLAVLGSDLYAGGYFTTAGGTAVNYVARWNGTSWLPLGTSPNDGVNDAVFTFATMGSTLLVGGQFDHAAGSTIAANRIAAWNGTSWSALGNGVNSSVLSFTPNPVISVAPSAQVLDIAVAGGSVYATGTFTSSGITGTNNIAVFDTSAGGQWSPLGSGIGGSGRALALSGNDVYVGGSFDVGGSKTSGDLAHWNATTVSAVPRDISGLAGEFSLDQNYPNPFNPTTAISYQLSAGSAVSLKVYDVLGRLVATLANGFQRAGRHTVHFDGSGLASGIYYYRLRAGESMITKKLVLLK